MGGTTCAYLPLATSHAQVLFATPVFKHCFLDLFGRSFKVGNSANSTVPSAAGHGLSSSPASPRHLAAAVVADVAAAVVAAAVAAVAIAVVAAVG